MWTVRTEELRERHQCAISGRQRAHMQSHRASPSIALPGRTLGPPTTEGPLDQRSTRAHPSLEISHASDAEWAANRRFTRVNRG